MIKLVCRGFKLLEADKGYLNRYIKHLETDVEKKMQTAKKISQKLDESDVADQSLRLLRKLKEQLPNFKLAVLKNLDG